MQSLLDVAVKTGSDELSIEHSEPMKKVDEQEEVFIEFESML